MTIQMMTLSQIDLERINTNDDFIAIKRYDYSLKKLLDRYPEGCSDKVIAAALGINEEEVENEYQQIVVKLQKLIGV